MNDESRRPILAQLYSSTSAQRAEWSRRYARIETAIPRAVQLLMLYGKHGSVIELSHADYGFGIGSVRLVMRRTPAGLPRGWQVVADWEPIKKGS